MTCPLVVYHIVSANVKILDGAVCHCFIESLQRTHFLCWHDILQEGDVRERSTPRAPVSIVNSFEQHSHPFSAAPIVRPLAPV